MSVEAVEPLTPQNAGNGDKISSLPLTTFDDDNSIRRLEDGSVVGEAHIGAGALVRLVELRKAPVDQISWLRIGYAIGAISAERYTAAEELAGQN